MVAGVASGKSLADEFERIGEEGSETPRSALLDISHGTLRRYGRVQAIVRALSHRGRADPIVEALLWCSLYALESGRYAEYTVVDQAVRAGAMLEKWSAKGKVTAMLRGYRREGRSIEARIAADPEARYEHPGWWSAALGAAYPVDWEGILAAGNTHPPMCLRVNRRRGQVGGDQARLAGSGIATRKIGHDALLLERALPVERLPGFERGEVSVQDAGAQRAARCLDLADGQSVLDACAAPGGKSAHILETADVALTALDADAARCARLERNLSRLGLGAAIACAHCTRLGEWGSGPPFDPIPADLPFSASGLARRHPGLKWLRRGQDLPAFAKRQSAILDALLQALAPDGKLLYVTCSVFPQENEEVVEAFVARTQDARRVPPPDGAAEQWLPGPEHDGFYYALIEKQA